MKGTKVQFFLRIFLLVMLSVTMVTGQAEARFIQADWFEVTEPGVGTNRYAYCNNDPINCFDPGGNEAWDLLRDSEESDEANAQAAIAALERAERIRERGTWFDQFLDNIGIDGYWEGRAQNHTSRIGQAWSERAVGDAIVGAEIGSLAAGGGAAIQIGRNAITRSVAAAATRREVVRLAAIEAAERLGMDLTEATISRGVARATIGTAQSLDPRD